jgi:hypothetical protein
VNSNSLFLAGEGEGYLLPGCLAFQCIGVFLKHCYRRWWQVYIGDGPIYFVFEEIQDFLPTDIFPFRGSFNDLSGCTDQQFRQIKRFDGIFVIVDLGLGKCTEFHHQEDKKKSLFHRKLKIQDSRLTDSQPEGVVDRCAELAYVGSGGFSFGLSGRVDGAEGEGVLFPGTEVVGAQNF